MVKQSNIKTEFLRGELGQGFEKSVRQKKGAGLNLPVWRPSEALDTISEPAPERELFTYRFVSIENFRGFQTQTPSE